MFRFEHATAINWFHGGNRGTYYSELLKYAILFVLSSKLSVVGLALDDADRAPEMQAALANLNRLFSFLDSSSADFYASFLIIFAVVVSKSLLSSMTTLFSSCAEVTLLCSDFCGGGRSGIQRILFYHQTTC